MTGPNLKSWENVPGTSDNDPTTKVTLASLSPALFACVITALLTISSPAAAQSWVLAINQILRPSESRTSESGRFAFIYQHDGNLVLYRTYDWAPLWNSGTVTTSPNFVAMQDDGNLVVYDASSRAVWATNTDGNAGSQLVVQDDGNVVLYREDGTHTWHSHTQIPYGPLAAGNDMQPNEILLPGERILSNNGLYSLAYQGDGNLVIYQQGSAKWSSRTSGQPAGVLIMQDDGNVVIYSHGLGVIWVQFPNCA